MTRLIDADALEEHKFVGNKFVQIGGRTNGKTLESINKAYQQGWNDCIDAIIENAPTVEIPVARWDCYCEGQKVGYEKALSERPQGEWIMDNEHTKNPLLWYKCNLCGVYHSPTNFCPNCGARMGVTDENG